jgi:hypothetical protein
MGKYGMLSRGERVWEIHVLYETKIFCLLKFFLCRIQIVKSFIYWYSQNPKNQNTYKLKPGEMIIIDNMAMLHARTEFPETDKRLLYRMWYNGKSKYNLDIGFKA